MNYLFRHANNYSTSLKTGVETRKKEMEWFLVSNKTSTEKNGRVKLVVLGFFVLSLSMFFANNPSQCNGRRDRQIGHVGGRERALRQREEAVRSTAAPGRAILRVFRCVIANARAWGLKTWSLDERRDWRHGKPSGGQAFAATHPMFGTVDCYHLCQAFCVAHQSLSCHAKALGVIRWTSHRRSF